MKILLMEDEMQLRKNIEKFLRLKGHTIDAFENGEQVIQNTNPCDYDCMILDINTPEVDGFELLEYIRNNDIRTPALFISALTDVNKVLAAFELGAGDYLKKPFELAELEARVLRLCPNQSSDRLRIDQHHEYDLEQRLLLCDGKPCKLSTTQKKILYLLLSNQNALVTFNMLIDYVWEDKEISHNTILSTMRDLKKRVPENLIRNIKGEGYMISL